MFFFRIKNKVFKTSRIVTIGRGAPFQILNEDYDVARAHCRVAHKNGKFYIKSLSQEAAVFLDNKEIPVGKYVEVHKNSELKVASHTLKLMETYKGSDFIPLNRFHSPMVYLSKAPAWKKYLMYALYTNIVGLGTLYLLPELNVSFAESIGSNFLLAGIFFGIKQLTVHFGCRNDDVIVNEVYIGPSGLTLHYRQTNMSIKFIDIKSVYMGHKCLYIRAHDQTFRITHIKKLDRLFASVLERAPLESRNKKPKSVYEVKIVYASLLLSTAIVNGLAFYMVSSWGKEDLMIALTFFTILLNSLVFGDKMIFKNSKTEAMEEKRVRFLNMFLVSASLFYAFEFYGWTSQESSFNKCVKGERSSCSQVSFWHLRESRHSDLVGLKADLKKICEISPEYCQKVQKEVSRSIATEEM